MRHLSPAVPTHRHRRSRLAVIGLALLVTAWFTEHARSGRYGFATRARLEARAADLAVEIARLDATRRALAHEVALLAAEPPSADLVEEIARDVLGFARPQDRILPR
jgi:cell division protein FtsB